MGQKKITMQVIADTVGVSKYVVSKTLNNKPGVSDITRQKILFAAKQLGYLKEGQLAPSTQLNRKIEVENGYILVFLPNSQYQSITYTYWGSVYQGISVGIQSKKAGMIVITSEMDLSKKVDVTNLIGIITLGTLDEQSLVALSGYGIPIVMIDHEDKLMRADSIFMDNRSGVERITDHLIGLGHKNITFIGELKHSRSFFDRWIGFRTVIEKAGLEQATTLMDITYNDDMEDEIQLKLNSWKKEKIPFPTAFVCANDHIARRVINLFEDNGLSCPRDVSVTGFDLLDEEEGQTPALTTVQVLKQVIGRRAVDRLVWRINHSEYPPEKILISGDMLLKESIDVPRDR
ncbi:LacI family DNA-binding transcriptional regulator [Alkalicoccobacillus murimartini]|uniref:LacI family transcriptional regulator n=1 Tax=Alkalicoccobacillus murimartini TaxID=171685 RepID=A0ABT9YI22_9BACI|nr:LacI family DNA-binding transcriptional regulator [Alkalicoccobacillus murimartini]MDQ0206684.1 LacI family transcriptional regulator [Alkalicoccobacillus murimartini]